MIRWRTLNKGDNIEEETNAEIQIEHLLETFQTALKIHQRGERVDAKSKYELILENDIMTEEDTEEQTKGDALHSSSLVLLRFLVFKNYAAIIEEEATLPSCTKDEHDSLLAKAMDYYIKALMIDPSERSLWQRIGLIADTLGNLRLARSSFEKGLSPDPTSKISQLSWPPMTTTRLTEEKKVQSLFNNGNISPIQWRCLEGLCDVLYKIGDYDLCNIYLASGLHRYPSWPFGRRLTANMNTTAEMSSTTSNDQFQQTSLYDDAASTQSNQPIIMHIATPTWADLISALLEQYKQTYTTKKDESENDHKGKAGINTRYLLMNRAVQIHIDAVDGTTTNKVIQDTDMADVDASTNKNTHNAISTPQSKQEQQTNVDNSEIYDDTKDTTTTASDMAISSKSTTSTITDTTSATINLKSEDESIEIDETMAQQNGLKATDDSSSSNPPTTTKHQNDQQTTDQSTSTIHQQNDQQSAIDLPISTPPLITHQQNEQSNKVPSNSSPPAAIQQQNDQQPTDKQLAWNNYAQNDKLANIKKQDIVDLTLDDDTESSGPFKRKRDDQDDNGDITSPLKRTRDDQIDKANDDNDDDEDDDDEHENEDKRASLRTAKRQKEKMESEEVSKKKMMSEESELSTKAQGVFDTFGDMNGLRRGSPWFNPTELDIEAPVLESFWDYFDAKVSELGTNFTWNFDSMKAKDDLFSPTSKKHQFAKFETLDSSSSLSSTNDESSTIRKFINSLNENNSGTADSLCQTVIAVLQRGLEQSGELDDNTTNLTIDAVEILGQEILSSILHNDCQDLWMPTNDYMEQIQLLTSFSEKLVDRLIGVIQTEQSFSSGTSLSSKQRMLMEKQHKLIKQNHERCNFWVDLIGNSFIYETMNSFGPCDLTGGDSTSSSDQWITKKKLLARYWLLKGKLALCENDVDAAVGWYKKCERLFENAISGELDMTLSCTYDAVVNLSVIERKMQLMKRHKYFASSKSKLDADDYVGALSQLETLMLTQTKSDQVNDTHDNFPMAIMLATCYMKTDRHLDAWKCYTDVLVTLIKELVLYGGNRMINCNILSKNDDLEFFRLLCSIDTVVDALVRLLLETKCQDWLPKSLDPRFIDTLMILLRTTIIYTFRHPDFIPLVNNFSNPDMTPHAPSKKTKINSYNGVTAKSWVMISTLVQHKMQQENSDTDLASLANLLQNVHDELGEREVCGTSKGIFIQHLVKLLSNVAVNEHRRGIYQCYHCLYGVHLVAEAELIEEHHATHGTLDTKAAEHLYSLVIDDVLVKIDRNLPLKNDLKDAIETVSALFEDLPDDNPYIQRNREIIKNYLERPVNINQSIKSMLRQCDLPIDITHTDPSSLSVVYEHMFFIRGKTLRQHIKNRPKGSSDRTMVDLEEALDEFQRHVIVHPEDHQGWYELGSTLMQLADEELTWSAVNIVTHHNLIIDYQKQAFHCFMKTWQLSSYGYRLKREQLFGFFTSFGSLIYGMTCAPMEMASFGGGQSSKMLGKNGSLQDIKPKKPSPLLAYRLSLEFYSRALKYKSYDQSEWRTLLAIGKCFKNFNRPPKEVLGWYIKSIRQCQDSSSTGNIPLDPTYKLYAALLKFLYYGSIEPADVTFYLNQISSTPNADSQPPATASTTPTPLCRAAEDSSSMTGIVDLTISDDESHAPQGPKSVRKMKAFDLLFEKLTELRKRDKKHVYHRPLYKIAWMHYKIYNDAQKAKTEILQLFTLKQTNKGLLSIWRPEYERPGKHFVFIKQYVTFLIDLAEETNDLETLKNMCRKLKRAGTTLLKEDEGFRAALSAYINVLQKEVLLPHQGSAKRQQIITGLVDKDEFDTMLKDFTNVLISSTDANPSTVAILQDLVEIRRQAIGYVSTENLDTAIQECFAILLFERTKVQSLLSEVSATTTTTTSSPPTSSGPSIQKVDGNISQANESNGTETPSAMDVSNDTDHAPVVTNESKDQSGERQKGIEGSILSLRARTLVSSLFGTVRA